MKFFGIKEAGVRKVRANKFFFLRFDTIGARGEKKILAQKKTLKNALFYFFARAPRMSVDQKKLQAPCAPKPL